MLVNYYKLENILNNFEDYFLGDFEYKIIIITPQRSALAIITTAIINILSQGEIKLHTTNSQELSSYWMIRQFRVAITIL